MTRRVIIRPEAKRDLRTATAWYRDISRDLSKDFVIRVDEAIRLAQERPLAFQFVHRTFRRILVHRFPCALFYHVDEARIVVVALLHQARDPEVLQSRKA
jgi:plasmid stabilization system protein ParE